MSQRHTWEKYGWFFLWSCASNFIHDFYFRVSNGFIIFNEDYRYMILLIFIKWMTPWEEGYMAPSIISTMIDIPLKLGSTVNKKEK